MQLIILVSTFFVVLDNISFFEHVLKIYPLTLHNIAYLFSLFVVLLSFTILVFTLLSSKYTTKPILIIALLVSSATNYFMNTYHVVIDDSMIRNTLQTNVDESMDLVTIKELMYILFLGVLPAVFVYKVKIQYGNLKMEVISKLKTIFLSILIIGILLFSFSQFYTSFFREHKPLRFYTNPTYWIYSIGNYIDKTYNNATVVLKEIGKDAVFKKEDGSRKLVIMVVGEAARADRFSLNGYKRETNPLLQKQDIVNFPNMFSCGTSTADSVPCMFSMYDRSDYTYKKGISTTDVLDILNLNDNIEVLWRDNNSDSKGVALRVKHENYKDPKINTICDSECRDEGMLIGLDTYIDSHKDKDVFIVLHQMGNHGPAYYRRYPKEFEKFTPVCETNQLEECTQEEVSNAYDNAILYSDYFLSKVIDFLKQYSTKYETTMIYMSDHGESLGENGVYLHGLPYFMAPDTQTNVGAFMWFGADKIEKDINISKLQLNANKEYSHDNLFHTLLNLFEVKTKVYNPDKDILYDVQKNK